MLEFFLFELSLLGSSLLDVSLLELSLPHNGANTVGYSPGWDVVISVVGMYVINVFLRVIIVTLDFAQLISFGTYMIVGLWML